MSTMEFLIISIALTICNVGSIAWIFLQYMPRRLKTFSERQERWRQIDAICLDVVTNTVVEKVAVFMLSNGGGEPLPGVQYYATSMVSQVSDIKEHHPPKFERIELDEDYMMMIHKLKNVKRMAFIVDQMPYGLLRYVYEGEKVSFSEVHYLCSTHEATYYMSFSTYKDKHLQPAWGEMLRAVSSIKANLKAAYSGAK